MWLWQSLVSSVVAVNSVFPCQYHASNAALLFVCRPGAKEGPIRSTNSHPNSKHTLCTVTAV